MRLTTVKIRRDTEVIHELVDDLLYLPTKGETMVVDDEVFQVRSVTHVIACEHSSLVNKEVILDVY